MVKLDRKLRDLTKTAKKREKRVADMTPEERAAYDAWKRSHKPGTPADRARTRAQRRQNAEARAKIAHMQATPPSAEAAEDPERDEKPIRPYEGAFS